MYYPYILALFTVEVASNYYAKSYANTRISLVLLGMNPIKTYLV
jgi:hypothetical protein